MEFDCTRSNNRGMRNNMPDDGIEIPDSLRHDAEGTCLCDNARDKCLLTPEERRHQGKVWSHDAVPCKRSLPDDTALILRHRLEGR